MNWKLLLGLVGAICIAFLVFRGCYPGASTEIAIPENAETQEVQGIMDQVVQEQFEAGGP